MATSHAAGEVPVTGGPVSGSDVRAGARFADFWELTKPRLSRLAAVISAAGFYMGYRGTFGLSAWLSLGNIFVATFVVSAGAMALNMYLERDLDARMVRTRNRPLPSGRVAPGPAFVAGIGLSVIGIVQLCATANFLSGAVGALAVLSYAMIYTPMKRISNLCTIVGAIPGALPPVIGYAAATGRIDFPCMLLFTIMFLWQMPHFLAIAWLYREDYARSGMPMLTVIDQEGKMTARQVVIYSLALLVVSLMPTWIHLTGWIYASVALASGAGFTVLGVQWLMKKDMAGARRVFFASLFHITLLFVLMTADKV